MSDKKIYGVDGMTRQQFERDLRSRYQHDNVRRKERGIRIDLEWDEKDIQERVTLNYGKANCPGCGAFDVGMSEVTFDRECIGCQARMRAANGLGPTPKPEYVVRFEHLSGLPPTQGADARPEAIRDRTRDELFSEYFEDREGSAKVAEHAYRQGWKDRATYTVVPPQKPVSDEVKP